MTTGRRTFAGAVLCGLVMGLAGCGGGSAPPTDELPQTDTLTETGRALDVGIVGPGVLVLQSSDGRQRSYSRWGHLDIGHDGTLIHADGGQELGVASAATGQPAPVRLPTVLPPVATRVVRLSAQLDARGPVLDASVPFDPADRGSYQHSMGMNGFGPDGQALLLAVYFRQERDDPAAGADATRWQVRVTVDGVLALSGLTLRFAPGTAEPLPGSALSITLPAGDAGLTQPIDLDLSGISRDAAPTSAVLPQVDGLPRGDLITAYVDKDGWLVGAYSNGQLVKGDQVLLARFTAADLLQRAGRGSWVCREGCQPPELAPPLSGRMGHLIMGRLNADR